MIVQKKLGIVKLQRFIGMLRYMHQRACLPRIRFNVFSTDAVKAVDQPRGCSGHGRMEGSLNPIANSNQNIVKAAPDTLSIQLSVKSVNSQILSFYKTFLKKVLLNLNVKYSMIGMPTKIKRITLLKSPHVNKSAREQFEMKTYKTAIDIHNIKVSSLKYIIFNKPKAVTVAFKTIQ